MYRREWLKRGWELAAGSVASLVVLDALALADTDAPHHSFRAARRTRVSSQAMGTHINTTAVCVDPDQARTVIRAALDELEMVDRLMTIHRDDSDLGRTNRSQGGSLDIRTLEVARKACELAALTDGALDPTILPLMRYWGFVSGQDRLPTREDVEAVVDQVGYRRFRVAGDKVLLEAGTEIDFGGIAKGYGVDRAVDCARGEGVRNVMVEAGGDLFAAGRPSPGRRWTIGIRDPEHPDRIFATIEVEDEAVATSGGYEKFRIVGGARVPHLLNPKTGLAARGTISATIIARSTIEADALATAAFVMGSTASMELISELPGVEGLWVDSNGRRWMTPGLRNRVQFV